mmetsp:Transcript_96125/g.271798  ORF Transcript_96125/g.271798 Transcript_96125/m.271798 type:complete len:255 (+) Transcript_96125:493-1257(+)
MAVAVTLSSTVAAAMASAMAASMASAMAAAMTVIFRAILVMAMATLVSTAVAAMAAMAAMVAMARQLLRHLSLFLQVDVEEMRHVVGADVRELRHFHAAFHRWQDLRELVDRPDAVLATDRLFGRGEVQLVQDNLVGKSNLLVSLVDFTCLNVVVEAGHEVLGVRDRHDSIQAQIFRKGRVGHEGADDGDRICHACSFYHDGVDIVPLFHVGQNLLKTFGKIAADRATHAPVVHDNDLFCEIELRVLFKQRVVD